MTRREAVVLVADDDDAVRGMVAELLTREGHRVLSASDGREALEISRTYPGTLHLVITDIDMPGLDGTDLCFHLLAERPGIRVLMMSGGTRLEPSRKGGGVPLLPKPFDGETLRARVNALLAPQAGRQERGHD